MGDALNLDCVVTTASKVKSSLIIFYWVGPGGNTITNDSRVTISPTTSNGNNYTSSIQFTYLMEGDEGTYTCNVMILETNGSASDNLETLASKLPSTNIRSTI